MAIRGHEQYIEFQPEGMLEKLGINADNLDYLDNPEALGNPLADKVYVVTGVGKKGGVGRDVVKLLYSLGATLAIGTRQDKTFKEVQELVGGDEEGRLFHFSADLTKPEEIDQSISEIYSKWGTINGGVINLAAGGLDKVSVSLSKLFLNVEKLPPEEKDEGMKQLEKDVQELLKKKKALNFGKQINTKGTQMLMDRILPFMEKGADAIYFSSYWSSLFESLRTTRKMPGFYTVVAWTKHAAENWFEANSERFAQYGVKTSVISADVIAETGVGSLFENAVLKTLPEEKQTAVADSFVQKPDVAKLFAHLFVKPKTWGNKALRIFMHRERNKIKLFDNIPPTHTVYDTEYKVSAYQEEVVLAA